MKIRITNVDMTNGDGSVTLAECGMVVGDILEVDGYFGDGSYCVVAIRGTEYVKVGDNISVNENECEVVE